ncbi:MAG: hypothetical protein M1832_002721 [Thelocarpon impressellum]|nr:MAG: hypothetical protein M1832_002721 [Thelocarpon impressellum]
MARARLPLSSVLPPLVCGTATFNSQYNADPYALPTTDIVHRALSLGVRAFDTSPYYGPAEQLLGKALDTSFVRERFPRGEYFLSTKVGRLGGSEFDYSPGWVRRSIQRSLERLRTDYVDIVYCHDVEFVSADEVLGAVKELRRIRDETGTVHYVGISGYPVDVLCELAELVLADTGEPLDAVMSYANFTLQNTTLATKGLPRLEAAGVDVVPNASPLGMGLLRRTGVPVGGQGDFHPSGDGMREAVRRASDYCDAQGEKLEAVAIRFALEGWFREGGIVGSTGDAASGVAWKRGKAGEAGRRKLGISVLGVSFVEELDEIMRVWRSILDELEDGQEGAIAAGRQGSDHEWSLKGQDEISRLADGVRQALGEWVDRTWASPGPDFARAPPGPRAPSSSAATAGRADEWLAHDAPIAVRVTDSMETEVDMRRRSRL